MDEPTITYILKPLGINRVKIGKTRNLVSRISGIRTGCPVRLKILRAFDGDHEKALHRKFHKERRQGEWFELSPRLREWILANPTGEAVGCPRTSKHPTAERIIKWFKQAGGDICPKPDLVMKKHPYSSVVAGWVTERDLAEHDGSGFGLSLRMGTQGGTGHYERKRWCVGTCKAAERLVRQKCAARWWVTIAEKDSEWKIERYKSERPKLMDVGDICGFPRKHFLPPTEEPSQVFWPDLPHPKVYWRHLAEYAAEKSVEVRKKYRLVFFEKDQSAEDWALDDLRECMRRARQP